MQQKMETDSENSNNSTLPGCARTCWEEEKCIKGFNDDSSTSLGASSVRAPSTSSAHSELFNTIPPILNGKYFKIVKKITRTDHQKAAIGIIASCQLCPTKRTIQGSVKITSNFVFHLRTKHPSQYEEYLADKRMNGKTVRVFKFKRSKIDEKLLAFIVDTLSSLSIVENPSFRSLFDETHIEICSRSHIVSLLETKFNLFMSSLKQSLKHVQYVCTTADIWSSGTKSFFGYTCHWIDSDYSRHSAALACYRFTGKPSADEIADLIHLLNSEFGLNEEKIVCTISGNGSNFSKAFKEFGINNHFGIEESDTTNQDSDDDIEFDSDLQELSSRLPKHNRCGSYTLNILATSNFYKLLKANKRAYKKHLSTLNRCSNIWNKCVRPKTAEIINNLLGCSLKTPDITHWDSLFDSLKNLLNYKEKLDELCLALDISKFNITEMQYMEDYCSLMEPIADGMDFLQNESNMFYGYFLPTLLTIKVKLRKLYESGRLSHLNDIAKEMENALVQSFKSTFEIKPESYDYVIAAISCPSIKMKFIKPLKDTAVINSLNDFKSLFVEYANKFHEETIQTGRPVSFNFDQNPDGETKSMQVNSQYPQELSYFDFDEVDEETKPTHLPYVEKEVSLYLADKDCSLSSLTRYPIVKEMFMKYNTPLPSSAPVERLFSFAEIVDRQRRQSLSDEHFEQLVIMRANKVI